jgi:agmatine deiminase
MGHLLEAQRSIAELCVALATVGDERVRLLVKDERLRDEARKLVAERCELEFVLADYGDCWVRDTLPLFGRNADGSSGALAFEFNGWGGKYEMAHDGEIGDWVARRSGARTASSSWVLEGGALEFDGQGTYLSTRSCVFHPERNPGRTEQQFEAELKRLVECERLVWLERGLEHDHTDGHVDMLARFVEPGRVVCMRPAPNDPNETVLRELAETLEEADLEVISLPSPGAVSWRGEWLPGSYCNFYIANRAVVVPCYGTPSDRETLDILTDCFPNREIVGLEARDLLWGGGVFHCVTQPEPEVS